MVVTDGVFDSANGGSGGSTSGESGTGNGSLRSGPGRLFVVAGSVNANGVVSGGGNVSALVIVAF
jgi:hypothetical protein